MKKPVLTCVLIPVFLFFLIPSGLFAQGQNNLWDFFRVGSAFISMQFGFGPSSLSGIPISYSDFESSGSTLFLFGSVTPRIIIARVLALGAEVGFFEAGGHFLYGGEEFALSYVEMFVSPILNFQAPFGNNFSFELSAGPYLGYVFGGNLKNEATLREEALTTAENSSIWGLVQGINSFDFGWMLGTNFHIWLDKNFSISLGGRVHFGGEMKIYSVEYVGDFNTKTTTLLATIGIAFH
jgi:hypothetical protein